MNKLRWYNYLLLPVVAFVGVWIGVLGILLGTLPIFAYFLFGDNAAAKTMTGIYHFLPYIGGPVGGVAIIWWYVRWVGKKEVI